MPIETTGQLRALLADVLTDLRAGKIDPATARAIASVAGEINKSLAVEVATAIQQEKLASSYEPGCMTLATHQEKLATLKGESWCNQCDARIELVDAVQCKSKFCDLRPKILSGEVVGST